MKFRREASNLFGSAPFALSKPSYFGASGSARPRRTTMSDPAKQPVTLAELRRTGVVRQPTPSPVKKSALKFSQRERHLTLKRAILSNRAGDVQRLLALSEDDPAELRLHASTPYQNNQTLLHHTAQAKNCAAFAKLLVDAGATVDYVDEFGWTPLRYMYYYGQEEGVQVLVGAGASLENELRKDTWPDILLAADSGDVAEIKRLVKGAASRGEELNKRDAFGQSALHKAALRGHVKACEYLLKKGAQVNCQDAFSWTPLMCAARRGMVEVVSVLLSAKADAAVLDVEGFNVVHTAAQYGRAAVLKVILKRFPQLAGGVQHTPTTMHTPAMLGVAYPEVITVLAQKSKEADFFRPAAYSVTAMGLALHVGSWESCQALLKAGVGINHPCQQDVLSPLTFLCAHAYSEEDVKLARLLIKNGADVNAVCKSDARAATPLSACVQNGTDAACDILCLLLDRGADPSLMDGAALSAAVMMGDSRNLRLLLKASSYSGQAVLEDRIGAVANGHPDGKRVSLHFALRHFFSFSFPFVLFSEVVSFE